MSDKATDRWAKAVGLRVTSGNTVTPLIGGKLAFAAFHDAIVTAEGPGHYIYLLGWWLDDLIPLVDKEGSSIAALFRKATLKGVQIRVMLWDSTQEKGQKNTAEVKRVNELPTGAGILDNNTLTFGSHHQKVLIVKGKRGLIGFCGGIDINADRIRAIERSPGSPYHDVHCQIEGPAVSELVDVFAQRWLAHSQHCEHDRKHGPLLGLSDRNAPVRPAKGDHYVGIARTYNFVEKWKACSKDRSIRSAMLGAIRAARRFIYIEDQYLVNFDAVQAVQEALSNIQYLTIVIAHSSIADLPKIWWARTVLIEALRKRAARKDQIRIFYRFSPGPKRFGEYSYVHSKTWIIDDELAVIGSANFNRRSWTYDSEVAAAIFDGPPSVEKHSFAQALRIKLWAKHLGLSDKDPTLTNWLEAGRYWTDGKLPSTAVVAPYDPAEGKDSGFVQQEPDWFSQTDPTGDNLLPCGESATVVRCS